MTLGLLSPAQYLHLLACLEEQSWFFLQYVTIRQVLQGHSTPPKLPHIKSKYKSHKDKENPTPTPLAGTAIVWSLKA